MSQPSPQPHRNLFVWDTGTTGKTPGQHAISEIAVRALTSPTSSDDGAPPLFSTLMLPSDLPADTPLPLPDVPRFAPAWAQVLAFVAAHRDADADQPPVLVAHNCAFDGAFVAAELARNRTAHPSFLFSCSLSLLQELDLGLPLSQSMLAAHFGVIERRAHHAHDDVRVLAEVLGHLQTHCAALEADAVDFMALLRQRALPLSAFAAHPTTAPEHTITFETNGRSQVYITTRTGRFYHSDADCHNLRSAKLKIPVEVPDPRLLPCHRCVFEAASPRAGATNSALRSIKAEIPSAESEEALYITTRTGRYYHCDAACGKLRWAREKIPVAVPNPRLLPCSRCVSQAASPAPSNARAARQSDVRATTPSAGVATYITTRTGRFFHANESCRNLRSARVKLRVTTPDAHLRPCYLCITEPLPPFASSSSPPTPAPSSRPAGDTRSNAGTRRATKEYITTRTGRFYHADDACKNLRSARVKLRTTEPSAALQPCYVCVHDAAIRDVEGDTLNVVKRSLSQSFDEETGEAGVGLEKAVVDVVSQAENESMHALRQAYDQGQDQKPIKLEASPTRIEDSSFDDTSLDDTSFDDGSFDDTGFDDTGFDTADATNKTDETNKDTKELKRDSLKAYGGQFWQTRTGAKFHLEGCMYLRNREKKKVQPEEGELEACRKCLNTLFITWECNRWNASSFA